jgi:L-gulonate 3-dehydrogenase
MAAPQHERGAAMPVPLGGAMNKTPHHVTGGRHVAVVGAGLVGAGWAIVFARAGLDVRIFDASAQAAAGVLDHIGGQLAQLREFGLIDDPAVILARLSVSPSLAHAVQHAAYVQESVLERVEVKRQLMLDLQGLVAEDAVVGSSTSGIAASHFTEGLALAPRVLVVHPVNPPHLVPVVELVPSPATAATALALADELMRAVGQSVVRVNKEIEGFVLNRLQGVLLREAWALVQDGVASTDDIDKTMRDGLGCRWSFMGPFETIDLNAPGGVADYAARLGPLYQSIAASRAHAEGWPAPLVSLVEAERRQVLRQDDLAARRDWRDRELMALAAERRKRQAAR